MNSNGNTMCTRGKKLNNYINKTYDHIIKSLFEKKYELPSFEDNWKQLDPTVFFYSDFTTDCRMIHLKKKLNACKNKLNDCDLEVWSAHTKKRNPTGEVVWRLRQVIGAEFITAAWTKFYECASEYDIIPDQVREDNKLVSLHLCEAPGAFISSLNHYLALHYSNIKWQWRASTLNPYYEGNSPSHMIADDRFMFHTLSHWDFGVDYTGDLMIWNNSQAIIRNTKALGKVLLVTADGSIDCVETPDEQESVTSALHYCEIVTALQVLYKGGTFVFKLFTFFEHCTINLLYLVNYFFQKVHIFKPVTSKVGNSEVYIICLGFKGEDMVAPFFNHFESGYGTELYRQLALFPQDYIAPDFMTSLCKHAETLSNMQREAIEDNLRSFRNKPRDNFAYVKCQKEYVSRKFITHYNLRPIDSEQTILPENVYKEGKLNFFLKKQHKGSFNSRLVFESKDAQSKVDELQNELNSDVKRLNDFLQEEKTLELYSDVCVNIVFTLGRPVDKLLNSQFIYLPIFKLYQKIVSIEEFRSIIFKDLNMDVRIEISVNIYTLSFPDYSVQECYNVFEKRCCKILLKTISNLSHNDNLILRNFNLLTLFNVSLINVLCKNSFKSVTFCKTNEILFNGFCKWHIVLEENVLDDKMAVLNLLSIKDIIGDSLYDTIVLYNNEVYKNKCSQYLEVIQKEYDKNITET